MAYKLKKVNDYQHVLRISMLLNLAMAFQAKYKF